LFSQPPAGDGDSAALGMPVVFPIPTVFTVELQTIWAVTFCKLLYKSRENGDDFAISQRADGRRGVEDCDVFCDSPRCTLPRGIEHGRPPGVMPALVLSPFAHPAL